MAARPALRGNFEEHQPECWAPAYARRLLDAVGCADLGLDEPAAEHPALAAAADGWMALTGPADGPAEVCPVPLGACADGVLSALSALAPAGALRGLRGAALLAERAALNGYRRRGAISPGGHCRILHSLDGEIALNLARAEDAALLPAWLEQDLAIDPAAIDWAAVGAAVAGRESATLVERGRLLGLALAEVDAPLAPDPLPVIESAGPLGRRDRAPRVLDLSSLWAGPLCSRLLRLCGAEVVKLESLGRPDGARQGPADFFDRLNAGKRSVALDLGSARGCAQLRDLIRASDIVIEGSRPRALRQLGIDAEALLGEREGLSWISITGHGRAEPQAHWIAYGDDAGVAGGLSRIMRRASGSSLIVGDAIADPLTGLHAALFAWASWCAGGRSRLLALSLAGTVRACVEAFAPPSDSGWKLRAQAWQALLAARRCVVAEPLADSFADRPLAHASALGADTAAVLAQWSARC